MQVVDQFTSVFASLNIKPHINQGVMVVPVFNDIHGTKVTKALLEYGVTKTTALYLSGGKTPLQLYREMAEEEVVAPGAVGQVDERFGPKWHAKSNEQMIEETGLWRYFDMRGVSTKLILKNESREKTAEDYDTTLRQLIARYQRQIALLGIGADGHTAGLPAGANIWQEQTIAQDKTLLVTSYNDKTGPLGERVSMTFTGLSMMDVLIVAVFGPDKGTALEKMFSDGTEEDIPARFYKRPDIANKTFLITDQRV